VPSIMKTEAAPPTNAPAVCLMSIITVIRRKQNDT
jgi:hypothetical protein